MRKVKIRRQYDPSYKGTKFTPSGTSMTVPGQALTVKQIMERQAAGLSMEGAIRAGEYFEDNEIPIFEDMTEFHEWKEDQLRTIKETETAFRAVNKNRRDLEEKAKNPPKDPPKEPEAQKEEKPSEK